MSETSENRFGIILVVVGVFAAMAWMIYSQMDESAPEIDGISQPHDGDEPSRTNIPQRIPKAKEPKEAPLAIEAQALPTTEELHTPDYGFLLQRGSAKANFYLIDGRGERLCSTTPPTGTLYRRSNKMWVELDEACRFDNVQSAMFVHGRAQGGLEPGDYELDLNCSPYGGKRIAFTLERGQDFQQTVQLSIWREVIALKFVGENDRPLASIGFRPLVASASPTLKPKERGKKPKNVLQDAPGLFRRHGGGGFSRSYKDRGRSGVAYLLDQGRWHMPIYVGATNTIDLSLGSKNYGKRPYVISSTFADSVTVQREFQLSLSKIFASKLARMKVQNAEDVGNQSEVNDPRPLRPRGRFRKRAQQTFDVTVNDLSPTFSAFVLGISMKWGSQNNWHGTRTTLRLKEDLATKKITVAGLSFRRFRSSDKVNITLSGAGLGDPESFSFQHIISSQDRLDISSGKIDSFVPNKTLALRLIADDEKPLPWAEVSILPLKDDFVAQALRQQLDDNKAALEGIQPKVQFNAIESKAPDNPDYVGGYSVAPPAFLRGAQIRARFSKYGTWYNSRRRGQADVDGYLFTSLEGLKMGHLYVLYVWGKSRDANKPDKRLVFRAETGITDLGAITVNNLD